jgi:hypothetical protein
LIEGWDNESIATALQKPVGAVKALKMTESMESLDDQIDPRLQNAESSVQNTSAELFLQRARWARPSRSSPLHAGCF